MSAKTKTTKSPDAEHQSTSGLMLPLALFGVGFFMILSFVSSQVEPPKISAQNQPVGPSKTEFNYSPLPFSEPVEISIPSLDLESSVLSLGKNPDGTMEVPRKENHDRAAWYKYSPTPGQSGASILQGHVDYIDKGPGVFFRLGELGIGDKIQVKRKDGSVAVFSVYKLDSYSKAKFPSGQVYGQTDQPELRLITCGGKYDKISGEYESNVVAFAVLENPNKTIVKKSIKKFIEPPLSNRALP